MNNKEVAHLWANGARDKASGSNFYFEGVRLYSYGEHYLLGKLFKGKNGGRGLALINSSGYSSTTAKHTGYAIRALSSSAWNIIKVPHTEADTLQDHLGNLHYLMDEYNELEKKTALARQNLGYVLRAMDEAWGNFESYRHWFKLAKHAKKLPMMAAAKVEALKIKAQRLEGEAEAREAKKAERLRLAEVEALDKWRKGEDVRNNFYNSDIALRLSKDGERIETSRGASVPFKAGLRLYQSWKKDALTVFSGYEIGAYTVNESAPEAVTIGCHVIKAEEINRFFDGLKA